MHVIRGLSAENLFPFILNDNILSFFQEFLDQVLSLGFKEIVSRLDDIVRDGEKQFLSGVRVYFRSNQIRISFDGQVE